MKQEPMHTLVNLEKKELQELCFEVKETLAMGVVFPKKKNESK